MEDNNINNLNNVSLRREQIRKNICNQFKKDVDINIEKSKEEQKEAMKHEDKLGAGAKKREHLDPEDKFAVVMKEYGKGKLNSGSGDKVKDQKQALAIAYSESGLDKDKKKIKKGEEITEKSDLKDDKTSKIESNYVSWDKNIEEQCNQCINFIAEENKCKRVDGYISSQGHCDLFNQFELKENIEKSVDINKYDNILIKSLKQGSGESQNRFNDYLKKGFDLELKDLTDEDLINKYKEFTKKKEETNIIEKSLDVLIKAKKKENKEEEIEGETSKDNENKIIEFIKTNKSIDDEAYHKFAEGIGMNPHEAEEVIYRLLNEKLNESPEDKKVVEGKPENQLKGGKGDKMNLKKVAELYNVKIGDLYKQLEIGRKVEAEHTDNKEKIDEIVLDHLTENPVYYTEAMPKDWAEKEIKKES